MFTVVDENKLTFVWSNISGIFGETYCLCDDDISSQILWHLAAVPAKFCDSDISSELSFVVSNFSLALNDSFILCRFISFMCKKSRDET